MIIHLKMTEEETEELMEVARHVAKLSDILDELKDQVEEIKDKLDQIKDT